jgi:acyl-CoA synthetase (AMP-forming)/AMP-acid ligase II
MTDAETLRDVLQAHEAQQPDAPLLHSPETQRTLTYGQLARESRQLCARLHSMQLSPGDHVGFLLHNGYQATTIFLGVMAAGYVVTPLNLLSQGSALAYVLEHSNVRVVFTSTHYASQLDEALSLLSPRISSGIHTVIIDSDAVEAHAGFGERSLDAAVSGATAALLMYTSGTTGKPKGALLTHANLLHSARSVCLWHGLTASDKVLSSLPLYHINGQCIATLSPFASGGSIVAPHKFSASNWWKWVATYRPTWLNLVPTIIAYLLNDASAAGTEAPKWPDIRFARSASAPLPPEQHRAFEEIFGIDVIEAMGMTECASVVFCNPPIKEQRKYGTPGLPCGVTARVVSTDSGLALGDHSTGELQLRGANVMSGYYNAPQKTSEAISDDGWLRTGDLGHRDGDGFYFVTGRIKELIIKGGENIAPREIDEVLLAHPAVLEAAAVGIPDANYGQEILAAVVLKSGATCDEDTLRDHCLRLLGRYKTPKVFRFVAELPKGPSGKVQRLNLLV